MWVRDKNKAISDGVKQSYINGRVNAFKGQSHTETHRDMMSKLMKGKSSGSKNPQYGKCWITKEGVNKMVPKNNLKKWLTDGWKRGRKL